MIDSLLGSMVGGGYVVVDSALVGMVGWWMVFCVVMWMMMWLVRWVVWRRCDMWCGAV